jgi:hypothetical protein
MSNNKWIPDFKKWYDVSKDAYIIINNEAKSRMEEVLSESESITNKSIQFIAAIIAISGFFFKTFIDAKIPLSNNWWLVVFFVIPSSLFSILLFPKEVRSRGFQPKEFIVENLDNKDDVGYQEQIIYYNSIVNLQANIEFMMKKNTERAKLYKFGLLSTIVMFIAYIISYAILLPTLC